MDKSEIVKTAYIDTLPITSHKLWQLVLWFGNEKWDYCMKLKLIF